MAGWISSKLKVAETLLQQIDQQAAESLRKGEHKQSDDGFNDVVSSPKPSGIPPLRDQLKNNKKLPSSTPTPTPTPTPTLVNHNVSGIKSRSVGDFGKKDPKQNVSLKDSDWTELLNTPKQPFTGSKITRLKDGGIVKGNRKLVPKTPRKVVDGGGESSEGSKSELGKLEKNNGIGVKGNRGDSLEFNKSVVKVDSIDEGKRGVDVVEGDKKDDGSTLTENGDVAKDVLGGLKGSSLSSSDNESDSDSSSSSDSRDEREREEKRQRRRQILAEKAAAKAADAIKEQENVVARLEGEKQSLEKILEDQANQAAQEASELQSMMMEMMEATELEKQKHNHTRMEVLARMAKLETANADLAKSLATAQWNLEIKVNHVAELRQQVDVKQVVLEELRRNIDGAHQTRETLTHLMASKGFEMQKVMLEAECAFATDKISRLQEKEMKLEESINMTLKEMENPTEVEVELRRRLRQMTDHLIGKQAQVESLSSDKATLLFRIEAVSRLLGENKSLTDGVSNSECSIENLESGTWESIGSKLRPILENIIQSGRQHLGSLVRQLDAIFSAGPVFLARNPTAKIWSLVYLVSLHLWVLYILFSHSQSTQDSTSSSVVSLENINASIGV